MQNVGDLSWLRYVCYALWAAAALLLVSARTDVSGLSKPIKAASACVCIFLGMLAWTVQEKHSQAYSPRKMTTGIVLWVMQVRNHPGWPLHYDLALLLPSGAESQTFSTGTMGISDVPLPIGGGDTLQLEYRVWDDKILAIDELSGGHAGWRYRYSPSGWWMAYVGAVIAVGGLACLISALRRRAAGEELVYPDTLPDPVGDVQTLGLEAGKRLNRH
jgi:hypothetical protein